MYPPGQLHDLSLIEELNEPVSKELADIAIGDDLAGYEITVYPGILSTMDARASDYHGGWIYPHSPTTPWADPAHGQIYRNFLLDPRYKDVNGIPGHDEFWFIVERIWDVPAKYDPNNHGDWGRDANFHNVAGDAGTGSGIGWSCKDWIRCSGVSALALDWRAGRPAPELTSMGAYSAEAIRVVMPVPEPRVRQTYVYHWIAGRNDGGTLRPGLLEVWANNEKIATHTNINTIQKGIGSDNKIYIQRWMSLWEGDYTKALKRSAAHSVILTRVGRTFLEAVNDRPIRKGDNSHSWYRAYGISPMNTLVALSPAPKASDARLPDLNGGVVADFNWMPEVPKVGELVIFEVIDPDPEVTYGWDHHLDGKIDNEGTTTERAYTQVGAKTMSLYVDGQLSKRKQFQVVAAPLLQGDFTFEPSAPKVGEAVKLTVISPIASVSYSWDVDGLKGTGTEFTYTPATPGDKIANLAMNTKIVKTKTITVVAVTPTDPNIGRLEEAKLGMNKAVELVDEVINDLKS